MRPVFRAAALCVAVLCAAGCSELSVRPVQVWRAAVDYEYPSAPAGSPEFEAALDEFTESEALPVSGVRLLQNGDGAYPEMLSLIESAESTISLETYIVENDGTTDAFFAALKRAADRGVRVRFLTDAAGFGRSFIANVGELTEHGIEARVFNPFFLSWTIIRGNNRDHRKILVVDGKHAVLGGINLSDEQTGDGVSGWRDTALKISGAGAAAAERVFDETWEQGGRGWLGKTLPVAILNPVKQMIDAPFERIAEEIGIREEIAPEETPAEESLPEKSPADAGADSAAAVRVVSSSPDRAASPVHDLHVLGILGARERIDIACAYFVPPMNVRRALLRAAERGVKVRLLLPEVTDVRFVREIGMRFYGRLLRAGVEIYEWPHPILHSKTMAVDGKWITVGSANMDGRSYFLNYESVLALSDETTAREAHETFEQDLTKAKRLTLEQWQARGMKQKFLERALVPLAGQY